MKEVKKIMKKATSILMVVCMVTGLFAVMGNSIQTDAADSYKNWTFETAGMAGGSTTYATGIASLEESDLELDGSKFSGYVNFKKASRGLVTSSWAPSRLVFAGKGDFWSSSWSGSAIRFGLFDDGEGGTYLSWGIDSSNLFVCYGQPVQADSEMFLQVAFDYVDADDDGQTNDLQLHVWMNNTEVTKVGSAAAGWATVTGEELIIKDYVDSTPVYASAMITVDTDVAGYTPVEYRSVYELEVSGIEDNKTYFGDVTVNIATTAADGLLTKDLASVTVGGNTVSLIDGSFTIPAGTGATSIVVTDKMGRTQTYNITVNTGRTSYRNWTFSTAGMQDGTATYAEGIAKLNESNFELDGSKFSGYVNFKKARGLAGSTWSPSRLVFGNKNDSFWSGSAIRFGLYDDGEGTYLSWATNQDNNFVCYGQPVQADSEIFLQVAFDYVDTDDDGQKNDLQLHVWVNNTEVTNVGSQVANWALVTGEELIIKDYVDETPVYASAMITVDTDVDGYAPVEYRSAEMEVVRQEFTYDLADCKGTERFALDKSKFSGYLTFGGAATGGYKDWTFATAGMTGESATYAEGIARLDESKFELDGSKFSGYVNFKKAKGLAGATWSPSRLVFGNKNDSFWSGSAIRFGLFDDGEGGTYLSWATNQDNNFVCYGQPVEADSEIFLQVAFDYVDTDDDGQKNDLQLHVWVNNTEVTNVGSQVANWALVTGEELIIKDYVDSTPVYASAMITVDTDVDGYAPMEYRSPEVETSNSSGPLVGFGSAHDTSYGDNLIKFGLIYNEGQTYLTCSITDVNAEKTFDEIFTDKPVEIGQEILLQLSFDCIDNDEDGVEDDLKLGIWVDGISVTDTYRYLNNYAINDTEQKAFIYRRVNPSDEQQYLTVRSVSCNADRDYTGWSFATADIKNETLAGAELIESSHFATLGGYMLTGLGNFQINGRPADVGTVLRSTGDYVIERSYNGVTYENTIHLIDSRCNPVQIPAVTYDVLGGEEVMPILGHYIPYWKSYANEDGTETSICFTEDKYYELAKESGINLILWTESDAVGNNSAVLEQLRLAEKYNLGMYVWDTGFETMEEDAYWERMSEYSNYSSFLGINSIDEPTIASYGLSTDTHGDAYVKPAKVFNKYANLSGFVNLFPMLNKLKRTTEGDLATVYANYIKESAINAGAKVISYDRYPSGYDWTKVTEESEESGSGSGSGSSNWWDDLLGGLFPGVEGTEEKYVLVNSPEFYQNLSVIRSSAMENAIPFWTAIETGDYSDSEDTYRQIEREEILWYVNTALAYGSKGLTYYTVVEVDISTDLGNDGAAEHGMIDCKGNKTKWYGYVQDANEQVAAVDHVLMKSLHQGVIPIGDESYVSNCVGTLKECISPEQFGKYNLASVSTTGAEYGALAGVFKYYPNEAYDLAYDAYYIVNSDTTKQQTITLEFNEASTYSVVLDAKASYQKVPTTQCSIKVPAGEAVLVVIGKDLTKAAKEPQVIYYEDISPYRVNGEKVSLRAPEISLDAATNWTFDTAGISDMTLSGNVDRDKTGFVKKSGELLNLNNSRFKGYVTFGGAAPESTDMWSYAEPLLGFGTSTSSLYTNNLLKFGLATSGGKTYLAYGTVDPSGQVGTSEILMDKPVAVGEEIFLQVLFEYIDGDEDSVKNDLKLTISVNGNLADGEHIIENHATAETSQKAAVLLWQQAETSLTVRSADTSSDREGYIFAGWFTDEACTNAVAEETTSGGAYARFVDADILSVKTQLALDHTALRFVSTVDRLDYRMVGFDIRCGANGITTESKEVYPKIYGVGSNEIMEEYFPTVCSDFSRSFFAYNINNIPEEMQKAPFIVNSYWITKDGTKVYGDSVSYSVEEAIKMVEELETNS